MLKYIIYQVNSAKLVTMQHDLNSEEYKKKKRSMKKRNKWVTKYQH